jgi:ABC-2 type transport system permease protein
MTTATAAPRRAATLGAPRLTFSHLMRAEWISLRSLRATTISLLIGGVLSLLIAVGFSIMIAAMTRDQGAGLGGMPAADTMGTNAVLITQLVAVVIGVAAYAKEHATGSLRTQLAAAPRRISMLGAKAAVVALAMFVWSAIILALSFAGVAIVYTAFDFPLELSAARVVVPILGGAALVALSAILGLGVGALLRSENWSVTVVLVFLLFVPTVLLTLPFEWAPRIAELLMGETGSALYTVPAAFDADVVRDILLTIAWPAAALIAGMAVVRRRDA